MATGFTLGVFLVGLFLLAQGKAEITKTRMAEGRQVRLGGAIIMIPLFLTFLMSLVSKPQGIDLIPYFFDRLSSSTGIVLSIIGLVIGLAVVYMAAQEDKTKNADVR